MTLHRFWPLMLLIVGVTNVELAGCAATRRGINESLDWTVGEFYFVGKERTGFKGIRGDETWTVIYGKREETPTNWTEKLEVTNLPIAITFMNPSVRWNPESVLKKLEANERKKGCSEPWTVLQKDTTSILYERQNISCSTYLHQYEIDRIVMGRWYLWLIDYGIRDKALSTEERTVLIEKLLKAKVIVGE